MNPHNRAVRSRALAIGGVLCLWTLPVCPIRAATETVEVVETRPDDTNPMYHIVKTKDGHIFRVPKGMPIEKRDGLIVPMDSEEYFLKKLEDMKEQIKALDRRVDEIEKTVGVKTNKKNQETI